MTDENLFKMHNRCLRYLHGKRLQMILQTKYLELRLQLYVEKVMSSRNMVLQYNRAADRLRIWEW
jgi:hypothetical protein